MITIEKIKVIQDKILGRIVDQVTNGNQSKVLAEHGAFACGQFLSLNDKSQRGIHGSAAALLVIAEANGNRHKNLVEGLIKYLDTRSQIENIEPSKLKRDDENVIKICEMLYALSFVKPGLASTELLVAKLHSLLDKSQIESKGWNYFLGGQKIKMLPTAFAIQGLNSTGHDVNGSIFYLEEVLKSELKRPINDPTQFAKYVFSLYSLVFSKVLLAPESKKKYKKLFQSLVNSGVCNLMESLEQNIEYWPEVNDLSHEYIRIPWQLYLIAIASKLSPWYFSKVKVQRILKEIEEKSLNGGYKYMHSGPHLSTRTQAILYDTLSRIKEQLNSTFLYKIYNGIDLCLGIIRHRIFRIGTQLIVVMLGLYSVGLWWICGADPINDLGPEFMAQLLFWLYTIGNRNTQR